jgi:zinc transport system substrate-binding protein
MIPMSRKAWRRWAATLALPAVLTGCGPAAMVSNAHGRPVALAAFYPYYWAAARLAGADVAIGLITAAGAEPHDLELSPRQVAAIGRAGLVIYQRHFQPALDDAVRIAPPHDVLDVRGVLDDPVATGDPHVWLDPVAMQRIVAAVGTALATLAPARAADIHARQAATISDLQALDHDFAVGLRGCTHTEIVTNHEAFGHLARRYGLTQVGVTGLDPEAEPSPRRMADLVSLIRRDGVHTVFTETLASPRVADTLARESGATTATLDPLEGLAPGTSGDYLSIMRMNLTALQRGLNCPI